MNAAHGFPMIFFFFFSSDLGLGFTPTRTRLGGEDLGFMILSYPKTPVGLCLLFQASSFTFSLFSSNTQ